MIKQFFIKNFLPFTFVLIYLVSFRVCNIDGYSMYPTLDNNQIVVCNKLEQYKLNDIVVVKSSSFLPVEYIVKRVIDIQNGKVFLQGDNTDNSFDSRNFGYVEDDLILGVVHYL